MSGKRKEYQHKFCDLGTYHTGYAEKSVRQEKHEDTQEKGWSGRYFSL